MQNYNNKNQQQEKLFNQYMEEENLNSQDTNSNNQYNQKRKIPIQNDQLIDYLKTQGFVVSEVVENCMKNIDRGDFCENPYVDAPQKIGFNSIISAPHLHAYPLEMLKDNLLKAKKTLDVGSGSGYLTLAFAKMMSQNNGVCYGVEHIPQLVQQSMKNISKNHKEYLDKKNIIILEDDGRNGLEQFAPYDCIHVGAATDSIPQSLVDQLNFGGILMIPIGSFGYQDINVVLKDMNGQVNYYKALGVNYVPLTNKEYYIGNQNRNQNQQQQTNQNYNNNNKQQF